MYNKTKMEREEEGWVIILDKNLKKGVHNGNFLLGSAGFRTLYWETTALQSVPVHACMSHCIGMLAPGTQQLTALTSVNKLIAGDRRTTQPLWWNTNCSPQSRNAGAAAVVDSESLLIHIAKGVKCHVFWVYYPMYRQEDSIPCLKCLY